MNSSSPSSPKSLCLLPESPQAAPVQGGHFMNLFWNHSDKPQPHIYLLFASITGPPVSIPHTPSLPHPEHQCQQVRGLRASGWGGEAGRCGNELAQVKGCSPTPSGSKWRRQDFVFPNRTVVQRDGGEAPVTEDESGLTHEETQTVNHQEENVQSQQQFKICKLEHH